EAKADENCVGWVSARRARTPPLFAPRKMSAAGWGAPQYRYFVHLVAELCRRSKNSSGKSPARAPHASVPNCVGVPAHASATTSSQLSKKWPPTCAARSTSPTWDHRGERETNDGVILSSSARSAERLEGWQQARCVLPSFETRPSGAPQDDAEFVCSQYSVRALLRCLPRRSRRLHARGAEFELGDFAERVERRVGEQVRGGFHEGERDEHDAVGNGVVLARGQLDRAAPRGHADRVAGCDAEPRDGAARHRG